MMKTTIEKDEAALQAAMWAALGHPVRWAMVQVLAGLDGRAMPVSELARQLGMARAAVSSHLPQMLRVGLVEVRADAAGDGRKRCLALPATAQVAAMENGLEVDLGMGVVRFPQERMAA